MINYDQFLADRLAEALFWQIIPFLREQTPNEIQWLQGETKTIAMFVVLSLSHSQKLNTKQAKEISWLDPKLGQYKAKIMTRN